MNNKPMQYATYITVSAIKIALEQQEYLYTDDLSAMPDWGFADAGTNETPINYLITIRDFTRAVFAEIGIEIEFSGKNKHEKGVIIDIDDDKLNSLNLNADALRFGQTVVKVELGQLENYPDSALSAVYLNKNIFPAGNLATLTEVLVQDILTILPNQFFPKTS